MIAVPVGIQPGVEGATGAREPFHQQSALVRRVVKGRAEEVQRIAIPVPEILEGKR
jgi:hypothetical protein